MSCARWIRAWSGRTGTGDGGRGGSRCKLAGGREVGGGRKRGRAKVSEAKQKKRTRVGVLTACMPGCRYGERRRQSIHPQWSGIARKQIEPAEQLSKPALCATLRRPSTTTTTTLARRYGMSAPPRLSGSQALSRECQILPNGMKWNVVGNSSGAHVMSSAKRNDTADAGGSTAPSVVVSSFYTSPRVPNVPTMLCTGATRPCGLAINKCSVRHVTLSALPPNPN